MLSLNLLEAVLQGLSPIYFHHLNQVWVQFCLRIQGEMRIGRSPLEALTFALRQCQHYELRVISQTILQIQPVLELSDLSFRQKELLIALRCAELASVSSLSQILNWDRSHVHHRLAALIKKGYALKFYAEQGPRYFAIERQIEGTLKFKALQVVQDFINEYMRAPSRTSPASSATPATSATLATPATLATRSPALFTAADIMNSPLAPVYSVEQKGEG